MAVAAACSSTTGGKGTSSPSPSVPATSSGASPSATGFPSTPAASSSTPATGGCPTGAYCDDFSSSGSGWPVENKQHYFAQYDPFLGGTYRMGERTAATASEVAPFEITKIASDYSVQVDVDAVLAKTMPAPTSFGVSCWEHATKDGSSTGAFVILVSSTKASIGLWSDEDGSYHSITTKPVDGVLKTDGTANHLTVTCIQGTSGGSAQAQLAVTVNGTQVASANYAKGVSTFAWAVGPHIGLLASGESSDIFYDNFVITSKCQGEFC
jgi:hypothetical protein